MSADVHCVCGEKLSHADQICCPLPQWIRTLTEPISSRNIMEFICIANKTDFKNLTNRKKILFISSFILAIGRMDITVEGHIKTNIALYSKAKNGVIGHRKIEKYDFLDDKENHIRAHPSLYALQTMRFSQCCFYQGVDEDESGNRYHTWCDSPTSPKYVLCQQHSIWIVDAYKSALARLPDPLARLVIGYHVPEWTRLNINLPHPVTFGDFITTSQWR